MKTIRGKFLVHTVTKDVSNEAVHLHAVFGNSTNKEDNTFATATPAGELKITVSNKDAHGFFIPGKAYYLDISPAEPAPEPAPEPVAASAPVAAASEQKAA